MIPFPHDWIAWWTVKYDIELSEEARKKLALALEGEFNGDEEDEG